MPGATAKSRVVLYLVDLSGSTRKAEIREGYRRDLQVILDGLQPGDRFLLAVIDDNPLSQAQIPVNEYIEKPRFWEQNRLLQKARERKTKMGIVKTFEKLLLDTAKIRNRTKIRDGLLLAEKILAVYAPARPVLTISSDMIEESGELNFRRTELGNRRTEEIIQLDKKMQRFPRLSGVLVFVSGAGSGAYERMPSGQILAIERFWRAYLTESRAQVVFYGPRLLRFQPEDK